MSNERILAFFCIFTFAFPSLKSLPAGLTIDQLLAAHDEPDNSVDHYAVTQHEFGDKFQGDLILTHHQKQAFYGTGRYANTGLLSTISRWPKVAGYVWVPYTFNTSGGFSLADKVVVWSGLREIEKKTCVRFVSRTTQPDYVEIINGDGCYSELGRTGGKQLLSLTRFGCIYRGTVMHEFIHVLGFDHMHNHAARDDFVKIHFENVEPAMAHNFDKVDSAFGNFNTSYDYLSLMHYPRWAFTTNWQDTIVPLNSSYNDLIGSRALSSGDVQRIKNMYTC